jgi:hypothetical protein
MHSAVFRNRLKSFALNLLVSWAGWTPANHHRNPVIIKATAIARFSARHSDARNLVVATSIARYRALATTARGLGDKNRWWPQGGRLSDASAVGSQQLSSNWLTAPLWGKKGLGPVPRLGRRNP